MNQVPPAGGQLLQQLLWLFTLALPVATVTWTVTHEEIFREARESFTAQGTPRQRVPPEVLLGFSVPDPRLGDVPSV